MRRLRILIVGAGIAGTAAASFLARRGHEVTVVERAGAARSSGSPVDIRGGALEAVRALGAESALRGRDTGARTVAFVWDAPDGPRTRTVPMGLAIATAPLALDIPDPRVVEIHNEPGMSLAVHPAGGRPGAAFIFRADRAPTGSADQVGLLRARVRRDGVASP